jgi:hypothetical protein
MHEINYFPAREAVTGMRKTPCLIFGNGVEIETVVYAKTNQESKHLDRDWKTIFVLPQKIGTHVTGTDIVKVHFLPKTSLAERADEPELVSEGEVRQIQRDAMPGFLSLAQALKKNEVQIQGKDGDDFYLFADTNERFAAFLRQRCGFRGTLGGTQAWIKKSEFVSDENINKMIETRKLIESKMKGSNS